jgi:bifunctional NMN adenylyltransferase/nudix hydrolase
MDISKNNLLQYKHRKMAMNSNLIVFIGRFQPLHIGHVGIIEKALEMAQWLMIVIGSANEPPSPKNPFSFQERKDMIRACFDFQTQQRIRFVPSEDWMYEQDRWEQEIYTPVRKFADSKHIQTISLIGHRKDQSSFYLSCFPMWKLIEVERLSEANSTDIRSKWYEHGKLMSDSLISNDVWDYLLTQNGTFDERNDLGLDDRIEMLSKQVFEQRKYIELWKHSPYTPIFQAADSLVTATLSGKQHILLVHRKGNGLLALPGGHLDPQETLEECARRELAEETGVVLPDSLRWMSNKRFDAPDRSPWRRMITDVFHFSLDELDARDKQYLVVSIQAGSDAEVCRWYRIDSLQRSRFHDDHYQIIKHLVH